MNIRDVGFNCSGVVWRALTKLAFCMAVAWGLIARCQAQGTIAFNNLANNDATWNAQSGGLVYLWTGKDLSFELLNGDINFELYASSKGDWNSLTPVHTWLIGDGSALGISPTFATGG